MNREYYNWYSPAVHKNMELLVFGHAGAAILFFPARLGRFYDYENWGVIAALRPKIDAGQVQVFCVDSYDQQSFYSHWNNSEWKIKHHIRYEGYILNEVLPLIRYKNPGAYMIAAGCSLGAYHAMNITLRHPGAFNKIIGMSGRYELTHNIGHYKDLFYGYWDENIYFNMPLQYLPNINDLQTLDQLRKLEVVIIIGRDDVLLQNNWDMHNLLLEKGINCTMHIWDREVHRPRAWRKMVGVYF